MDKYKFAILSGICGSLAGFFGKLAFGESIELNNYKPDFIIGVLLRLFFFIINLILNKYMFQFLF